MALRCCHVQDLIARLLERKPTRRLGMLAGRAADIKRHKWFEALDWEALEARKVEPPRRPKDDSAKRLRELMVPIDQGSHLQAEGFAIRNPTPLCIMEMRDLLGFKACRRCLHCFGQVCRVFLASFCHGE